MELSNGFWEMAERFVNYIHSETGHSTIVCDGEGVIRKAYLKERIGAPHAGSKKILTTPVKEIAISAEDERRNPLTKEGLNCAIVIDGVKVATFGISGRLEIVTAVARLAAMVMAGWVKQLRQQDLLHSTAENASSQIGALTTRLESAIDNLESVGQATMRSVQEASTSIAATDKILDSVQQIALQTYLLSINASIEAGRLGKHGQAFGVVADEMGRLSQSAKKSMESIQQSMTEIRQAVANVEATSSQSSSLLAENATTMRAVSPVVHTLIGSIQTLESSFKENVH